MPLNNVTFERIDDQNDIQSLADSSRQKPVVIYKHSITCPVSAWAREEMIAFARETGHSVYEVLVQHARPVSNAIAERYGIRHESPQVIVLHQDQPVFHASHRRVTAQAVKDALVSDIAQEPDAATRVSN